MRTRTGLIGFIATVQSVLFLAHFFLFQTWTFSPSGDQFPGARWIGLVLGLLSVSYVAASVLAFRYSDLALCAFYKAAAIWLGLPTIPFTDAACYLVILSV